MAEPIAERLTRLLALVAYLSEHPGVPVSQVAEHFGTSEAQVVADVNLLWVTGTPGYLHDDLIDFSADALDHGVLTLTEARGMDRPLRLSSSEALALLLALRSVRELLTDRPAVESAALESAVEKLSRATGRAAEQAASVQVHVRPDVPGAAVADRLEAVRGAVARGRRLHLRYVSAADVVSERDVDPVEVHSDGVTWSLRAWCHRARGARTFRLDRILDLTELDEAAEHHPDLAWDSPGFGVDGRLVTLELESGARWVSENVPVESVEDLPDGTHRVVLRVWDQAWVTNLLLSAGDSVRAVDPPELATEVAGRARRALEEYAHLDG
ncbi:helix-turn-helix transcriptional regulator [Georgenia alba]|uniref:Helix-turn-helix transcriptional regulator n=1 Tax=Georgenia alba TaxID=2233858 RepID=A0ABW2QB41_9MICO